MISLNLISHDIELEKQLEKGLRNKDLDKIQEFKDGIENYWKKFELANENKESEEHYKTLFNDFLKQQYTYDINTQDRIDAVIFNNNKEPMVMIEVKRSLNISEMITDVDLNRKAFHELLLYYIANTKGNLFALNHLMVTDGQVVYLFTRKDIDDLLKLHKPMVDYIEKNRHLNDEIYSYIKNTLSNSIASVTMIKLDLRQTNQELLYKYLSRYYLFKERIEADANSLNQGFYNELLHILGLKEQEGKGLVFNGDGYSFFGTILSKVEGSDKEKFETALSLIIVWINRILFLKILEANLVRFSGEKFAPFLDSKKIEHVNMLAYLFFEVLRKEQRSEDVEKIFPGIPYLNSSLFDETSLEKRYPISLMFNLSTMTIMAGSVLEDKKKRSYLTYLLDFLNCYAFNTDKKVKNPDTVISASVLGLIFEKINNYKDGAYFTPSAVTMYMADESLQGLVLDKVNTAFGLNYESYDLLRKKLMFYNQADWDKLRTVLDEIKILDPAVGSGHFLVSCLNSLLKIKADLGVLDQSIEIKIENDELLVYYTNGDKFAYQLNEKGQMNDKKQEIQKLIFDEKRKIIENQLYGVDINPNSVNICRLRLWIELLKSTYYLDEQYKHVQILPNLEFKVMSANSLVSMEAKSGEFSFSDDIYKQHLEKLRENLGAYFGLKENKQAAKTAIMDIFDELKKDRGYVNEQDEYLKGFNPFDTMIANKFFDAGLMFGIEKFDLVIGNPPYGVELNKQEKQYFQKYYKCANSTKGGLKGSTDTFAVFIEHGLNLLKQEPASRLSYIVPLAVGSSDAMQALHGLLDEKCENIKWASFSNRPNQIFPNADLRVSILFLTQGQQRLSSLYTTKNNKRYKEQSLEDLLKNLSFVNSMAYRLPGRWPKFGQTIEPNIILKMSQHALLGKQITWDNLGSGHAPVYYRTSGGRYYHLITTFSTGSTKEKAIYVAKQYQKALCAILSSSLYYWFYHCYSNTLDLKQPELYLFPCQLDLLTPSMINQLNTLCDEYMANLQQHKEQWPKHVQYYPRKAKHLLDAIDATIAPFYGLDQSELDFIVNYDSQFRTDDK